MIGRQDPPGSETCLDTALPLHVDHPAEAVLETLPAVIVLLGADGSIRGANAAARAFTGLDMAALRALSWQELVHPRDVPRALRAWRRAARRATAFRAVLRLRRAAGDWVVMLCRAAAVPPGKPHALLCSDLGPQRAAEAAARAARAAAELVEEASGIGSWELDLATGMLRFSPTSCAMQGMPERAVPEPMRLADWFARLEPEDRPAAEAAMLAAIRDGTPLRHEFRIRRVDTGACRWLERRGRRLDAPDGTALRLVGVDVDITERKVAELQASLALREVEHRAKNALAAAQALVRLTRAADQREFTRAVEQRLAALGRAHARLSSGYGQSGFILRPLIEEEFAPYDPDRTLALRGAEVALTVPAVQPFSMALHELVTNAAKYGALARPGGRVLLSWRRLERGGLVLCWRETGGPEIAGPPSRRGFGSTMLDGLVRGQLGGAVSLRWRGDGLGVRLALPAACIAAPLGG